MIQRKSEEVIADSLVAPVRDAAEDTVRWLSIVRRLVVAFGVMNVIVLASVSVAAVAGGQVNTFMWVRAGVLLAATPLLYRWSVKVEHGWVPAYGKLRRLSIVLPIALVVVDFIPGVCPSWYAWLQACAAAMLLGAGGVLGRRDLKDLFTRGA